MENVALRAGSQRYNAIFSSMSEGVVIQDTAGRIEECNASAERILGLTADQMAGRTSVDPRWRAVHEDGSPFPGETHPAMVTLRTGEPLTNVIMGVHKPDASLTWISINSRLILSGDGSPSGVVATFTDITGRKRAQDQLRKSEEKFAFAFHASPAIITLCELGESSRLVEVNEAFETGTGYSREEVLGRSPFDLGLWSDRSASHPLLKEFRDTGRLKDYEHTFRRKDGELRDGLTSAEVLELDGRPHAISSSLDITDRKRAREALEQAHRAVAEAEQHYRFLFNSVSDAVFVFELQPDGLSSPFLDVNEIACREFGYSREEFLRMRIVDIAEPGSFQEVPALVHRLLREKHMLREGVLLARDGTRLPVEIRTRQLSTEGPRIVISSVRNISDRKAAEAARLQIEEHLRQTQTLEGIGKLAGGIAHEFNNLLTVINGYCHFLLNSIPPPDPLHNYVQSISKSGERAASLTRQLLAFSRKQMFQPRDLDLNATILAAEQLLQPLLDPNILLATFPNPTLGVVHADPDQLHQVLVNLVVNARDAMPSGGTLEIRAVNVDVCEDGVANAPVRPYVRLSVTDTGYGMDEDTRRQAFEPFFTTKDVGQGTGLGLSTVYGIVKQSGGWVELASQPGAGTSFSLYLPRIGGAA